MLLLLLLLLRPHFIPARFVCDIFITPLAFIGRE